MASMVATTEIVQADSIDKQSTSVAPCRRRIRWLVASHVIAMLAMATFQSVKPWT
jgi:hypothetical protein